MIRPAGPQDVPFLRDMLRHAYYWRVESVSESGEPPVQRYVERWGRPGDTALIAIQDFQRVGAAWYRLFTTDNRGYGFVDEETPELSIAIVPSKRGHGPRLRAPGRAAGSRARADGYDAISLSVEKDSPAVGLYERHGFAARGEDDGGVTMRADLAVADRRTRRDHARAAPPRGLRPFAPAFEGSREKRHACVTASCRNCANDRPRRHATPPPLGSRPNPSEEHRDDGM